MIHLPEKKDSKPHFEGFLIAFLIILQSINLSAQQEIPDSLVAERIQCIRNMLDESKTKANWWWYGWTAAYSVSLVGQGIVLFVSDDRATRQDMALGASTSFLGAIWQLVMPLDPGRKGKTLSHISGSTPEERLKKLSDAEELLKEIAITEKTGRSWKIHALYGAADLGCGLITWLGFKRSVWDGVGNFAFNTIICEALIWTQPTRAIKDYQSYCQKYKSGENTVESKPKLTCYVYPYPGGIAVKILF